MASNINPFNIDGTYPVAGQDNDSQGFRDNFTNIRNNLSYAKSELEDLQAKAVLKSALNGTTLNNDFGGAAIVNAQLRAVSDSILDLGILSGTVNLDFSLANFHKVQTSGAITVAFGNGTSNTWPSTGKYGRLILWVTVSDVSHTLQIPLGSPGVTRGYADIASINPTSGVITFDTPGDYVFEFSTQDNGTNVLIQDLIRNRATFRDPSFYFNSTISPSLYLGFNANSLVTAQSIEPDADVLNTHEGINVISAGDLWTANVHSPLMTYSELPGYHTYAARGNLDQNSVLPVSSSDPIGYVTPRAYTGNGTGNAWVNFSSIQFYATGSNVTYGLGGNVTVWTAQNGNNAVTRMKQAVGIENDQSTKFFGNVVMTPSTPSGPTAVGTAGQFAIDSNYIYVCVATNSWKRVAISNAGW